MESHRLSVPALPTLGLLATCLASSSITAQWKQDATFPATHVNAIAISPSFGTDKLVFAGTLGTGVFRGTPHKSWVAVNSAFVPLPGGGYSSYTLSDVDCLAISPFFAADRTLFAGTAANGLYRSRDRGNTWFLMVKGITGARIHAVAFSPNYASDSTVIVGTRDAGVFRSTDGGNHFVSVAPTIDAAAITFSPNYAADRQVFLGTSLGTAAPGLLLSTDGGATFVPLPFGVPNVVALAASPGYALDRRMLLGNSSGALGYSADGGASWGGMLFTGIVSAVAYAPTFPADDTLVAAVSGGTTGSLVRGAYGPLATPTFAPLAGTLAAPIQCLALAPNFGASRRAFVGTAGLGFQTYDGL